MMVEHLHPHAYMWVRETLRRWPETSRSKIIYPPLARACDTSYLAVVLNTTPFPSTLENLVPVLQKRHIMCGLGPGRGESSGTIFWSKGGLDSDAEENKLIASGVP